MPPNHHNSNVTSTRLGRSSPLSKMDQQYNPLSLAAISNYKLAQLTFAPPDSHSIRKRTLVKNMLEHLYEVTPPEWLDQMTRWEFISPDQVAIPPDGIESIINEYAEVIYNTTGMDPMDDDEEFYDVDDDDIAREKEANMYQDDEDMWIDDEDDDQFQTTQRRNFTKRISAGNGSTEGGKLTGNNLYGMSNEQLSSASISSLASKSANSITSNSINKDIGGSEKEEIDFGALEGKDSLHPLISKPTSVQKPVRQKKEIHPLPPTPSALPSTNPFRTRLSWATQSTLHRTAPIAASPARLSTDLTDLFNMSFDVGHLEINTAPKLPALSFQPEVTSPTEKGGPPTPVKDESFLTALMEAAARSSAATAAHSTPPRDARLRSPSLGNIPPPIEPPPPVPSKDDVGRTHSKRSSSLPDVRLPDAGRWTIRKMPALPPVPENDQGKEQAPGSTPRRTSSLSRKSTPRSLSSLFDPPTAAGKFVPEASDAFSTLQKYLATEAGAQQAKNVGFVNDDNGSINGKPKRKKSSDKKKLSVFGRKAFSIPIPSFGSLSTTSSSSLSLPNSSQTFFAQPSSQAQSRNSLDKALPPSPLPSPEDRNKIADRNTLSLIDKSAKLRRTSSLIGSPFAGMDSASAEAYESLRGRERSASNPNISARALTPPRSSSPPPSLHLSKSKKRRSGQSVAFRRATPSVSPSPSNPRILETEGLTSTPGGGVGFTPSSSNSTSNKSSLKKYKELKLHSSDPALVPASPLPRGLPMLPSATTPPRSPTSPRLNPRRVSTSLYGDVIDGVIVPTNSGGIGLGPPMGAPTMGISNGGRIGFHGPPPSARSSTTSTANAGPSFMKRMKDIGKLMKKNEKGSGGLRIAS